MSEELNEAVALKLGWEHQEDPDIGHWWKVPEGSPYHDGFGSADATPNWAGDLTAAMFLLTTWEEHGGSWIAETCYHGYHVKLRGNGRGEGDDKVLPLAITTAWLQAQEGVTT